MRQRKIYLVRHAESANNANEYHDGADGPKTKKRKYPRQPDPELTEKGSKQAAAVGAHLRKQLLHEEATLRPGKLVTSGTSGHGHRESYTGGGASF